jgi:hypothetical protein
LSAVIFRAGTYFKLSAVKIGLLKLNLRRSINLRARTYFKRRVSLVNFKFEKLHGPIYPAYLHLGAYSVALEPELIQSLKEIGGEEPTRFFESLIKKVGSNRYLKEMIEEGVLKSEDPAALARQLQEELRKL